DLRGRGNGDALARALAAMPEAASLTTIDLGETKLGDMGVRALAKSAHLGALQSLRLADNEIGPEGARALFRSKRSPKLVEVDISINPLGDDGIRAIAGTAVAARLRSLNVLGTLMDLPGVEALFAAKLDKLTTLNLADNQFGMLTGKVLAQARMPRLK